MTLSSMTGFSRAAGEFDGSRWTWEIRSVNGRGLDVRCRLGAGMEELEAAVRSAVGSRLHRGNVSATLNFSASSGEGELRINRRMLDRLVEIAAELGQQAGTEPPLAGILSMRGVVEVVEPELSDDQKAARGKALLESFGQALASLKSNRDAEGAHITAVIEGQIGDLEKLVAEARSHAARQPRAAKARLEERMAQLLGKDSTVSEERIAQEAALMANRSDVTEELDRLAAHGVAVRELLDAGESVGRRLEFLAQELNREANTLCAKSADLELTKAGLALKAVIDQFREQVANVE